MLVVVSDSSVLIDLARARLFEPAFALPYRFVIPDVMFADELLDLGSYTREDALSMGLRVARLDGDGVNTALGYAQRYVALSSNDAFALALASVNGWMLLAGDGELRRAAGAENVGVHRHLWLVDEMRHHGTVTRTRLLRVLEAWRDDPLVWLPVEELVARITRLRREDGMHGAGRFERESEAPAIARHENAAYRRRQAAAQSGPVDVRGRPAPRDLSPLTLRPHVVTATFLAIDFETANHSRDSACAVGLALCRGGQIVEVRQFLICPPRREFVFTYIHGLTWQQVCDAPSFGELWPTLRPYLDEAEYLVAHNAPFDRGVLAACARSHGLAEPAAPFECTVRIARRQWAIYPTKLPNVCHRLGIALRHHDAGSDAQACAQIVLAAQRAGWTR